ncbi:MAG: ATPase V [Bacteroidales bacterium]|nr:ATPase V [Bacteroidales bacterium]
MIERMTKYSFILLSADKEKFLADLTELGVVDITRASKPVDAESGRILASATAIKKQIANLEAETSDELKALHEELTAERRKYIAALPWGDYSSEALEGLKARGLEIHFHQTPAKKFDSQWENLVPIQVISNLKGSTYFISILEAGQQMPKELAACETDAPKGQAKDLEARVKELEAEQAKCLEEIRAAKEREIPLLKAEYEKTMGRLDGYLANVSGDKAAEETLTVFTGFAPVTEDERLSKAFDAMDVYYIKEQAAPEDNPPIKLKNSKFAREFERITGMYGMPVYSEFDPTPVISIFFLLFFAMCMGDAGYGLVLIIAGLLIHKNILKIGMFKGLGTLITILGVATLIVGLVMGTAFGIDLRTAAWVPEWLHKIMLPAKFPGTDYDYGMVLSIIIGVFHLCLAMTVKAVLYTQRFGFKHALSAWGWLILIVGGIATALLAITGVFSPDVTRWAIIIVGALSFLGIFLFNKPGRNPLLNIGAGLWDTYQTATGLLGDVLSYIRLYALGLAGGMLGGAFNTLGTMVLGDGGAGRWVAFVLILIIGHTLNLLMCCLGAFVHPLRLNFLEYFKNSGYEGMGAKYKPLKNNN